MLRIGSYQIRVASYVAGPPSKTTSMTKRLHLVKGCTLFAYLIPMPAQRGKMIKRISSQERGTDLRISKVHCSTMSTLPRNPAHISHMNTLSPQEPGKTEADHK